MPFGGNLYQRDNAVEANKIMHKDVNFGIMYEKSRQKQFKLSANGVWLNKVII
jgi:hypothetical protein